MATRLKPLQIVGVDSNAYPDRISNQITTSNPIGNFPCYVLADSVGSNNGVYVQGVVPKDYVGSPVMVVKGILDGAPGASDVLGIATTGIPIADNESMDQAHGSADAAQKTIGSSGDAYSDEDLFSINITLTNLAALVVDDVLQAYVYLNVTPTTYGGNFLLIYVGLQYSDT